MRVHAYANEEGQTMLTVCCRENSVAGGQKGDSQVRGMIFSMRTEATS